MRPREFIHFLEDFLTVIRLRQTLLSDESSESLFELTPGETLVEGNIQHRRKEIARTERNADAA